MKKKILAAVMAATMVFSLVACGSSDAGSNAATGSANAATESASAGTTSSSSSGDMIKVGIINNDPNESGYRTANDKDMKNTFTEANGYEASFAYSLKNDEQITAAQKFIQDGVDYLLLSAADTAGWDSVLKDAQDAGIRVILFDRTIDADESLYEASIVSDMAKEGQTAVDCNKIAALRRELKQVERRRDVQSKSRIESPAFRVALAGYTNAGKSTLLNRLTGSTVLSQDKLFATLDPTTRSYRLPGGRGMTITDTVGFIQKLPHGLVDAFKSTLSEVLGADLILKVVDASDEDYERQLEAVDRVLDEIGAGERLTLTVFNKIDLLDSVDRLSFRRRYPEAVLFSAQTGEGLDDLVDRIAREAAATDVLLSADIPYREGALITLVHEQGTLLHEEYLEDGVRIVAKLPARIAPRLERYRTE